MQANELNHMNNQIKISTYIADITISNPANSWTINNLQMSQKWEQIERRKLKTTSFTSITILAFENLPDIFPHKEIKHCVVLGG